MRPNWNRAATIVLVVGVIIVMGAVIYLVSGHRQVCHNIEKAKPNPVVFDKDLSADILEVLTSDVVNYSCGSRVLVTRTNDSTIFDCWINGTIRNRTEGCVCNFSFIGYDTIKICK